jgi:hypothetical protein
MSPLSTFNEPGSSREHRLLASQGNADLSTVRQSSVVCAESVYCQLSVTRLLIVMPSLIWGRATDAENIWVWRVPRKALNSKAIISKKKKKLFSNKWAWIEEKKANPTESYGNWFSPFADRIQQITCLCAPLAARMCMNVLCVVLQIRRFRLHSSAPNVTSSLLFWIHDFH